MSAPSTAQAAFTLKGRNPDVLTCIANLSNDEVFTPPEFANRMLDTVAEAWAAHPKARPVRVDSAAFVQLKVFQRVGLL